jgi:hypothetical protein
MNFKGKANRIDDYDLPRLGALIGVGEDELHAFMEVEAAGSGFDSAGRPKMLFEPHLFYRELSGEKRTEAVRQGLARATRKVNGKVPKYPNESYTRLAAAIKIDEEAAYRSASWGLTQILGKWHKDLGYATAKAMVEAFMDDEANHLEATIKLLKQWKVDDDLKAHRWTTVALAWNGPDQASHGYDRKLAREYARWSKIKDTAWPPKGWEPPQADVTQAQPAELPAKVEQQLPAGPAKDVVVTTAPGPKPGETAVILTPTPDTKPSEQTKKVSGTGWAAIVAFVLSIIAGAARYFGG